MKLYCAIFLSLLYAHAYSDVIYRCQLEDGSVLFSDLGCQPTQAQQRIQINVVLPQGRSHVRTYKSNSTTHAKRTKKSAAGSVFRIAADSDDDCRKLDRSLAKIRSELANGYSIKRGEKLKAKREALRKQRKSRCF